MKKYLFALIPFILGIGCFAAYIIIGSEVVLDGTLMEAFGFIQLVTC
jgi:hypothetical protein